MPLPKITSLQFLILAYLCARERSGREIREMMDREHAAKSLPAFYQLMSRLEDSKLVDGRSHKIVIDGQPLHERRYKITNAGRSAWQATADFYNSPSVMLPGVANG